MGELSMRIFITGGTGFVGKTVVGTLAQEGHEITVLTRKISRGAGLTQGVSLVEGDPMEPGDWQEAAGGHEVLINLAGASIFTRWTRASKDMIRESRVRTTRNLVQALEARRGQGTLFLSASAVGYYGFHEDEALDEMSPPGDDFLAGISKDWEAAALEAVSPDTRVAVLRFGIVLGREGGALQQMIPVFRRYVGSPLGSGQQWFSWIHEQDLADIFLFLMEQEDMNGPINCTTPHPVRNRELTTALGEALGKPTFMPAVPGFMLKLIMGEFGSILLKGQRVLPKKLLAQGFRFRFPEIKDALEDLIH